jgi:capsid protein
MGPLSAGAQLLGLGLQLQFSGNAAIMVPGFVASSSKVGFVQEGAAIPVVQFSASGATLEPRKFAAITTFTREIFQHSTPTIEGLVRTVLTESLALALDTALLDTTAGDATRPPGLRFGIAPITASNNSATGEAIWEDVSALATAVAAIGGNNPIVFVAAPSQAVALRMRLPPSIYKVTVLATSGLADGVVLAIASNAIASALDPVPRIDRASEATLHMSDAPSQFSTVGAPNTVAAPSRSLWQSDTIGLRLRFEVSWGLRNAAGLAWTQNVNW